MLPLSVLAKTYDITGGNFDGGAMVYTTDAPGSAVDETSLNGAGITGVDADTVDGEHASAFSVTGHTHDDRYYTKTEIQQSFSDAQHGWEDYADTAEGNANDYTDSEISALVLGETDHGALTGLSDDDHSQYILADGTRSFSGDVSVGTVSSGHSVKFINEATFFIPAAGGTVVTLASDANGCLYITNKNSSTYAKMLAGTPIAPYHVATKGYADGAFSLLGHDHDSDYVGIGDAIDMDGKNITDINETRYTQLSGSDVHGIYVDTESSLLLTNRTAGEYTKVLGGTPVAPYHFTTKGYVDTEVAGATNQYSTTSWSVSSPVMGNASVLTIQLKDAAGSNLSGYYVIELWTSGAAYGTPAEYTDANSVTTGTVIKEHTTDIYWTLQTDSSGKIVISFTRNTDGGVHIMHTSPVLKGKIYTTSLIWTPEEPI